MLKALVLLHFFLAPEICQRLLAREELIDILQLKTLGLGEEEVNDWYPGRVKNSEDNVCPPADIVDGRWCDLDDDL